MLRLTKWIFLALAGFSNSGLAASCESVTRVHLPAVIITSAAPANSSNASGGPISLPPHCVVEGMIDQRTGFNGKAFGIGFELRLPDQWNGRFLFQGGGGTDGVVRPAFGSANTTPAPALQRGFAVVSTDAGHQGLDASFGRDQQARIDYAYNALGRVTDIAKQIVAYFYERPIEKSYFMGCSNGGRQGMMASQRFPTLFDGIIAGDPGYHLTRAAVAEAWDNMALLSIAPKDDSGQAIFSQALTAGDMTLLSKAILDACDANDGLRDGMISRTIPACKFDPQTVACKPGQSNNCLTPAKVEVVEKVFAGPKTSRGDAIYSDWPWDAGIGESGWRDWKLGNSPTPKANARNMTLGADSLKGYFISPYDPNFDPLHVDFDRVQAKVRQTSAINDPDFTELGTFTGHGGKLILYHGMSDPVFSANDTIAYYDELAADNGGLEKTRQWARLFLIPGMNHCGGGSALDQFDALSALMDWVENGKPPSAVTATGKAFPGRSRPLCAYPEQSQYKGTGSTEEAANFECK